MQKPPLRCKRGSTMRNLRLTTVIGSRPVRTGRGPIQMGMCALNAMHARLKCQPLDNQRKTGRHCWSWRTRGQEGTTVYREQGRQARMTAVTCHAASCAVPQSSIKFNIYLLGDARKFEASSRDSFSLLTSLVSHVHPSQRDCLAASSRSQLTSVVRIRY